jgi:hypothetical protein
LVYLSPSRSIGYAIAEIITWERWGVNDLKRCRFKSWQGWDGTWRYGKSV